MHWCAKDGRDNEALRRLAVVLITLAAIAESVVRRSAPVRCLVLFLLCRAEARVCDLAFRTGAGASLVSIAAGSPLRLWVALEKRRGLPKGSGRLPPCSSTSLAKPHNG
jgi:hypothetical protein